MIHVALHTKSTWGWRHSRSPSPSPPPSPACASVDGRGWGAAEPLPEAGPPAARGSPRVEVGDGSGVARAPPPPPSFGMRRSPPALSAVAAADRAGVDDWATPPAVTPRSPAAATWQPQWANAGATGASVALDMGDGEGHPPRRTSGQRDRDSVDSDLTVSAAARPAETGGARSPGAGDSIAPRDDGCGGSTRTPRVGGGSRDGRPRRGSDRSATSCDGGRDGGGSDASVEGLGREVSLTSAAAEALADRIARAAQLLAMGGGEPPPLGRGAPPRAVVPYGDVAAAASALALRASTLEALTRGR